MSGEIKTTDNIESLTSRASQDSLSSHRHHDEIMRQAARTSADIDAKSITPPELTALITKKRGELEEKLPHPTRDKPTGREAIQRAFTGHWVPKMMQSYKATNKIITNVDSILTLLDITKKVVEQKQLREITALVSLVNELYSKGYRDPAGTDQRPTAEIKAELVMYQKAANRLEQQENFLRTGQRLPTIDKTLSQRLEQLLTQKNLEKLSTQAEYLLMSKFAEQFPAVAEIIRSTPPAMQLVVEAAKAGVIFGGYAEDGPAKISHAYTQNRRVYIPKAWTDYPAYIMGGFLFELTNAKNYSRFREVGQEGAESLITAKEYAYKLLEIEQDAVLKLGEICSQASEANTNSIWMDPFFMPYISAYKDYKEGTRTIHELVTMVLNTRVGNKTVEQKYIDQHNEMSSQIKQGSSLIH